VEVEHRPDVHIPGLAGPAAVCAAEERRTDVVAAGEQERSAVAAARAGADTRLRQEAIVLEAVDRKIVVVEADIVAGDVDLARRCS